MFAEWMHSNIMSSHKLGVFKASKTALEGKWTDLAALPWLAYLDLSSSNVNGPLPNGEESRLLLRTAGS